jgi:hypothetical protein
VIHDALFSIRGEGRRVAEHFNPMPLPTTALAASAVSKNFFAFLPLGTFDGLQICCALDEYKTGEYHQIAFSSFSYGATFSQLLHELNRFKNAKPNRLHSLCIDIFDTIMCAVSFCYFQ